MNPLDLMRQAKDLQDRMQQQMADTRVQATAGGGMVTVVVNGAKQLESIAIDPVGRVQGRRGDAAGYDRGGRERRASQGGRAAGPVDLRHDGRLEDSGSRLASGAASSHLRCCPSL